MHVETLPKGRGSVCGGAHERVAEVDTRGELDQTSAFRRGGGAPIDAEFLCRIPQQCCVARRLRGGQRQQGLRVRRQLAQPLGEGKLEMPGQGNAR